VRTCFKVLLGPWMDGWNCRRVYIKNCEDGMDGEDVRSEDLFQSPIGTLDGWMEL
jgi:allantoicase